METTHTAAVSEDELTPISALLHMLYCPADAHSFTSSGNGPRTASPPKDASFMSVPMPAAANAGAA